MILRIKLFWQKISEYGIPAGISPDEKKLHVTANQLMLATILLISTLASSLLIIWLILLRVDFAYYKYYFFGGGPPVVCLLLAICIFVYRGKTGRFFGPIVIFSYLMTLQIAIITIIFGGLYGLEYWILVVMGMGIFVLQRKPLLRRASISVSLVIFVGLRFWILYFPEILPVPYTPVRMFYYAVMAVSIFLFIFLEFRFIAQQGRRAEDAFIAQRDLADKLLLNIMPESVAHELKAKGKYEPRHYDAVTVLFTDFVGFTRLAATMQPAELLKSLEGAFGEFDRIVKKHGLEKLKTIGDSYMCAAGIPEPADDHAERACYAALEFRKIIADHKKSTTGDKQTFWDIRIGLNSGPVVAGIIGDYKFAYDIWGDTVNIASRMESAGEVGAVNISAATANLIAGKFTLRSRGMRSAKSLGEVEMFELVGVR